jgi:hypothetical protein
MRRPTISRRCTKIWTPADERSFHRSLALLRADIASHGGVEGWLEHGIEDWLAPARCAVRLARH